MYSNSSFKIKTSCIYLIIKKEGNVYQQQLNDYGILNHDRRIIKQQVS